MCVSPIAGTQTWGNGEGCGREQASEGTSRREREREDERKGETRAYHTHKRVVPDYTYLHTGPALKLTAGDRGRTNERTGGPLTAMRTSLSVAIRAWALLPVLRQSPGQSQFQACVHRHWRKKKKKEKERGRFLLKGS